MITFVFLVKKIVECIDLTENNEKFLHTAGEPAYDRKLLTLISLVN